jgi:rubrerythrin
MLKTILSLLKDSEPSMSGSNNNELMKQVELHVEIERVMLEKMLELVDSVEDSRIRFIIQNIINDERKHHSIMKRLYTLLYEEVTDEKWWDFIFRVSRLKG